MDNFRCKRLTLPAIVSNTAVNEDPAVRVRT